ncbi:hypothetical protein CPC08DRAFT_727450 [Agrocybe pediades]|nr:hypothetical protein CPC08DRAFT_727450 [Agrocybe pediades]
MDPLTITLAVITLATAVKDLTELAQKLHESFTQPRRNMRLAQSLAADTLEIVQDLDKYYQSHRNALDKMPEVRDAVVALTKDMKSVYDKCLPFFQLETSPPKGIRKTILLIELWMKRKELESNIRNLKEQANKCYRRFTTHTQLGTVVAIGELKDAVADGFSSTDRQLSALQVSDENVLAFMGSTRGVLFTLPPGVTLSEDLVFKLYLRGQVNKIDSILKDLVSKQSYLSEESDTPHVEPDTPHVEPDAPHAEPDVPPAEPFFVASILFKTFAEVELVKGNAIADLIKVQRGLQNVKVYRSTIQEGAEALNKLSVDLLRLEMYSECPILSVWSVDLYRMLSKSHRDAYAPKLAVALCTLATLSFNTGNLSQAIAASKEGLDLLETIAHIPGISQVKAAMLTQSARVRRENKEDPSGPLQAIQESVSLFERLGVDRMTITGPESQTSSASIGGVQRRDTLILQYAVALDALRLCLHDSQKQQEALDVAKKAFGIFHKLAQCYGNVGSRIVDLCTFICQDAFRDKIPLSNALTYAEDALKISESVEEISWGEAEDITDALAVKTNLLIRSRRPSDALATFQKLASRVRRMTEDQWMPVRMLQFSSSIFYELGYYTEAVTTSKTILEIARPLANSFPPFTWFDILMQNMNHCNSVNHLSEALRMNEEALAVAKQQLEKDAAFGPHYFNCVERLVTLTLEAGYPQRAAEHVHVALQALSLPSGLPFFAIVELFSQAALCGLRLGFPDVAGHTIDKGLDIVKAAQTEVDLREDIWFGRLLLVWACSARCSRIKTDELLESIKVLALRVTWRVESLCILSDLQADMGDDAEALRTAKAAVESTQHYSSDSSVPELREKYMAQYTLTLRLFYNGDLVRARQLILQVRGFYEWHAHSRNAWFIDLARALQAEGVLECASDRHAEGHAAYTRLMELLQRLETTFPDLRYQVKVGLKYEQNFLFWDRLLDKYPLTCSHWVKSSEEGDSGQDSGQDPDA